jgi:hypothetical protein
VQLLARCGAMAVLYWEDGEREPVIDAACFERSAL